MHKTTKRAIDIVLEPHRDKIGRILVKGDGRTSPADVFVSFELVYSVEGCGCRYVSEFLLIWREDVPTVFESKPPLRMSNVIEAISAINQNNENIEILSNKTNDIMKKFYPLF